MAGLVLETSRLNGKICKGNFLGSRRILFNGILNQLGQQGGIAAAGAAGTIDVAATAAAAAAEATDVGQLQLEGIAAAGLARKKCMRLGWGE